MPENKEVEILAALALFQCFREAEGGHYFMSLILQNHLACAEQRYVVGD